MQSKYAVITENDESDWGDITGVMYHFPKRYLKYLPSATRVVYYKGKMINPEFASKRLSKDPHYFGMATIGDVYRDAQSAKEDYFAEILDFRRFTVPVPIRDLKGTVELIPESRRKNYWRDGVRLITHEVYERILKHARGTSMVKEDLERYGPRDSDSLQGLPAALESLPEGDKTLRFVTTYERDPRLRRLAIKLHGLKCAACGFDFGIRYGEHGKGFIHVHHLVPVSQQGGKKEVNPKDGMTVLCANCHCMVHRFKDRTLTVQELRSLLKG